MKFNAKNIQLWLYIVLICILVRGAFFYTNLHQPLAITEPYTFDVRTGSNFSRLLEELAAADILKNAFDLKVYARLTGQAELIKAGEYSITPGLSALGLLGILVRGEVNYHQLVIPEGWTARQALLSVQGNSAIMVTLPEGDLVELGLALGIEGSVEGLFFPDTYNFTRGTSELEIFRQAYELMQEVLAIEWDGRDVGLPYETAYEALIMASIVEKETALASERGQIAGVFVRRLQQNMRLQTDPTVIYGLGADFNGDLTRANLRSDSPYNTYTRSGLPEGPIALPGKEAIVASLHPEQGNSLYFVAKGDGSHYFSATLEEHNEAVRRYQLNQP